MSQSVKAGSHATIVQAGRDAILSLPKCPPNIKLVRIGILDDEQDGGLRQKVNIILKNNGDLTAFLISGTFLSTAREEICLCNEIGMQYSLSTADWTYDIDISKESSTFIGRHSIAPNEVVNFDIVVGRKKGGHGPTIYRAMLRFDFDEGESLETDPFFLQISGPTVFRGGYQAHGPTAEEWGRCQADNIRRLDAIGYDYRGFINKDSRKYVEAAAPGIFDKLRKR